MKYENNLVDEGINRRTACWLCFPEQHLKACVWREHLQRNYSHSLKARCPLSAPCSC